MENTLTAADFTERSQSPPPPYCAICLNDICGGDSDRKLPECGHSFHSNCIDAWLRSHSTCPLCRSQVVRMISLNENREQWNDFLCDILVLLQDFVRRMCNPPLNDEVSSMLCGNIGCIS